MTHAERALIGALSLSLVVVGCKLQETPPAGVVSAKNVCTAATAASDCGNGTCLVTATSAPCSENATCACFSGPPFVLPDHDLTFAITPAALSGFAGGRTYLIHGIARPDTNPAVLDDIVLDQPTLPLPVVVTPPAMAVGSDNCSWLSSAKTQIPIRSATFTNQDVALGLPGEVVVVPGSVAAAGVQLTPGIYDLYIEFDDDPSCPIPPVFVNGLDPLTQAPSIDLKTVATTSMHATLQMLGEIRTPSSVDFTDYRVEIVEESTGSRISTVGGVAPPQPCKSGGGYCSSFGRIVAGSDVPVPLEYFAPIPAKDGVPTRHWWLRLMPKTSPLPSYAFLDDVFVTTDEKRQPSLDFSGVSTSPVTVGVRIEDAATSAGVDGSVYVESVPGGLSGVPPEIVTSFSASATSDPSSPGDLRISLPPGKYRANGLSSGSTLGLEIADWDIPSSPAQQGGRLMTLHPPSPHSIRVTTPGGLPASNVVVELEAIQRRAGPFDAVFGAPRLTPRGASGITDTDGRVVIASDAGGYSLRVRFAPETLLPWTTQRLTDTSGAAIDLPAQLPIELNGNILGKGIAGTPGIQGGTLRVYTLAPAITDPITGDQYPARYVLVGEAELGADETSGPTSRRGTYRVLLPPQLD